MCCLGYFAAGLAGQSQAAPVVAAWLAGHSLSWAAEAVEGAALVGNRPAVVVMLAAVAAALADSIPAVALAAEAVEAALVDMEIVQIAAPMVAVGLVDLLVMLVVGLDP